MPRNGNPADIRIGKGRVPQGTVEDNSLRNPNRDVQPLKAHIDDPSRAHFAQAIAIVDAGNYYLSDEVEGALQEIGGGLSGGRMNGLISGGTFGSAGLTVTLNSTIVMLNGMAYDATGLSVVVPNATPKLYIYIRASDATLQQNLVAPTLTSGDILLWELTTAGGLVTASRDGRWFVYHIDRKPALTVRSDGVDGNRTSEANFISLTAALLWLELYAAAGPSSMETHRIIVRGAHTIAATISNLTVNTIFEGDGDASFVTGASLAPMFNLGNISGIKFKNINFVCNHVASTAITNTAGSDLAFEDCSFSTGSQTWVRAIYLTAATRLSCLRVQATVQDVAIRVDQAGGCVFQACVLTQSGATGAAGIYLWDTTLPTASQGRNSVLDCTLSGTWTDGINARGMNTTIKNCVISGTLTGIRLRDMSNGPNDAHAPIIESCRINVSNASSLTGIVLDGAANHAKITDCTVINSRGAWGGAVTPIGIDVNANMTNLVIANCSILGFFNTADVLGTGIDLGTGANYAKIIGCNISGGVTGIFVSTSDEVVIAETSILDTDIGIVGSGDRLNVSDVDIFLSSTRGRIGVSSAGGEARISNVYADLPRVGFGVEVIKGFDIQGGGTSLTACKAMNFHNTNNNTGTGILVSNVADHCVITGCTIKKSLEGVNTTETDTLIEGGFIEDVRKGVVSTALRTKVRGTRIDLSAAQGLTGIDLQAGANDALVMGCNLNITRVWGAPDADVPVGVTVNADRTTVQGCVITGFFNTDKNTGAGVLLGPNHIGSQVLGSEFYGDFIGVSIDIGNDGFSVVGNTMQGQSLTSYGVLMLGADAVNQRTRNFMVSNNTISQMKLAGILVSNFCTNGTLSGNNIDNYLPGTPYDPTGDGIRLEVPGATPPSSIVITGNVIQRCREGIIATGTDAKVLLDLTISGNQVRQTGFAEGAAVDAFTSGCKGIGLNWVRDAIVSNNTIKSVGRIVDNASTPGVPTAGGGNVFPSGIRFRNCGGIRVSGNEVDIIFPTGAGTGTGIAFQNRSTNNLITFAGIDIQGNTLGSVGTIGVFFQSDDGGLGPSDITNTSVSISGNSISGATINAIYVNLKGDVSLLGMRVHGNNISGVSDAAGQAIRLFVDPADALPELVGLTISENTIINPTASDADGIFVSLGRAAKQNTINVSNNTINLDGGNGHGVAFLDDGANATPTTNLTVANNTVTGAGDHAISAQLEHLSSATFSGNSFFAAEAYGIWITVGASERIVVTGNTYIGTRESDGFFFYTNDDGGTFEPSIGLTVTNNSAQDFLAAGVYIDANEPLWNVRVAGNSFSQESQASITGTIPTSRGVRIEADATGGGGEPVLKNVQIEGNVFSKILHYGVVIENEGATGFVVEDVAIRNNTFEDVTRARIEILDNTSIAGDSVTITSTVSDVSDTLTAGVEFAVGGSATATAANLVAAILASFPQANCWNNGAVVILMGDSWIVTTSDPTDIDVDATTGNAVFVRLDSPTKGLAITNNLFSRCGSTGNPGGVIAVWLQGDGQDYSDVDISGNQINGGPEGGITVSCQNAGGTNFAGDITRVTISNNKLLNPTTLNESTDADAIRFDWDGIVQIHNVDICSNRIFGLGWYAGISFEGNESTASGLKMTMVTVVGNDVQRVRDDGILVNFLSGPSTTISQYFKLDGNTVSTAGGDGVALVGVSPPLDGGSAGETFDLLEVSMCGNTISTCDGHGLRLRHDVGDGGQSELTNVMVANNVLSENGQGGVAGATSWDGGKHNLSLRITGITTHLTVGHNIMQGNSSGGYGFFIDLGDGNSEVSTGAGIFDSNQGTLISPLYSHNISRGNGNAAAANMTDVGAWGTNYPPTDGSNLGNIDQSSSGGTNNQWLDIDDAGWVIADYNNIG